MNAYENLRIKHHELLAMQSNPPEDFSTQIASFIEQLRQGGRDVYPTQERTQLREFARYWSALLFELDKSQGYKVVELLAYDGKPVKSFSYLKAASILAVILGTGLLCYFLYFTLIYQFTLPRSTQSAAPINPSQPTALFTTAGLEQTETQPPDPMVPTATLEQQPDVFIPINTVAAVLEGGGGILFTDMPSSTSTVQPLAGVANILSPKNGQEVFSWHVFQGEYSNLDAGWSIHVVLQPLSIGGIYFPLPDYFLVSQYQRTGSWSIETYLDEQLATNTPDTYIAILVLANSDTLRSQLTDVANKGLSALPEGVLVLYDQPVTFYRKTGQ
jgi:hypothetical protein